MSTFHLSKLSLRTLLPNLAKGRSCTASLSRKYSSVPVTITNEARPKVTINTIKKLYASNQPITVITAQDYPSGLFADKGGIDMTLVGDSLAMVTLGYDSTTEITVDEMLHHSRAVARGAKSTFRVADLPFGSYEVSPEIAVQNALRFIKEGNAEAVKLEGGIEMKETIKRITSVGIPVLGHIGLTPQRHNALGGFRVQGKTMEQALALLDDALAVQEAGCFAVVLEAIPEPVATYITKQLSIPTIGIGCGNGCSGQVLVLNDMIGVFDRFTPR
ncbi:cell wall biogenesis and architecture protein [Basidiobolus ranarum]|uniref:3-methyl-2-oxobutanoate hydroxymethyltransferase n=1 Tax=Basidiobolus ranarum TaxID=34480 RepID=A0ABR2WAW4_9FUNG